MATKTGTKGSQTFARCLLLTAAAGGSAGAALGMIVTADMIITSRAAEAEPLMHPPSFRHRSCS